MPRRNPSLLNHGFPLSVSALVSFRRAPFRGLLPGAKVWNLLSFSIKHNIASSLAFTSFSRLLLPCKSQLFLMNVLQEFGVDKPKVYPAADFQSYYLSLRVHAPKPSVFKHFLSFFRLYYRRRIKSPLMICTAAKRKSSPPPPPCFARKPSALKSYVPGLTAPSLSHHSNSEVFRSN